LLIRYRRAENGKPVAKAVVYTAGEHGIDRSGIDPDAIRIIERLRENGHEAYIVGGAVRDLLLGRKPKDFDIATDAQPSKIKRIFRSARVIGRRFRLVHVYAGPKIFEVSTFRSIANGTVGNEFGTVDEDARRRDFTLNALYYDPHDSTLVDYVGGFKDIHARRIEPVIPLKNIFKEDPVRMIRCVKYAAVAGFRIPLGVRLALKRDSSLLSQASASRLTEEFIKILGSGCSAPVIEALARFDLLRHILPEAARLVSEKRELKRAFLTELSELDSRARDPAQDRGLALLLAQYLKPFLEACLERFSDSPESYREALRISRLFLAPLNPPRVELEAAVLVVFKKRGISPLQRPRREGQDRSRPRERALDRERSGDRRRSAARPVQKGPGQKADAAERPPAEAGDAFPRPEGPQAEGARADGAAKKRRKRRRRRGGRGPSAGAPPESGEGGAG
jgi:poly(A) polymerase